MADPSPVSPAKEQAALETEEVSVAENKNAVENNTGAEGLQTESEIQSNGSDENVGGMSPPASTGALDQKEKMGEEMLSPNPSASLEPVESGYEAIVADEMLPPDEPGLPTKEGDDSDADQDSIYSAEYLKPPLGKCTHWQEPREPSPPTFEGEFEGSIADIVATYFNDDPDNDVWDMYMHQEPEMQPYIDTYKRTPWALSKPGCCLVRYFTFLSPPAALPSIMTILRHASLPAAQKGALAVAKLIEALATELSGAVDEDGVLTDHALPLSPMGAPEPDSLLIISKSPIEPIMESDEPDAEDVSAAASTLAPSMDNLLDGQAQEQEAPRAVSPGLEFKPLPEREDSSVFVAPAGVGQTADSTGNVAPGAPGPVMGRRSLDNIRHLPESLSSGESTSSSIVGKRHSLNSQMSRSRRRPESLNAAFRHLTESQFEQIFGGDMKTRVLEAAKAKDNLKGLLDDDDDETSVARRVWDLPVLPMAGVFLTWAAAIGYVYLWSRLNAAELHRSKLEAEWNLLSPIIRAAALDSGPKAVAALEYADLPPGILHEKVHDKLSQALQSRMLLNLYMDKVQEFNQAVQYRPDDLPGWGIGGLVLSFFLLTVAVSYLGKIFYGLRHPASD